MLAHLSAHHAGLCRQWFQELEPLGIDAGVLRLRAHSTIHRDYLQRHAADAFSDAARTVSQRLLTVQFLGPADEIPRASAAVELKPSAAQTVAADASIASSPSTSNHTGLAPHGPHGPTTHTPGGSTFNGHAANGSLNGSAVGNSSNHTAPASAPRAEPAAEFAPPRPAWPLVTPSRRPGDDALDINPDYSFENFVIGPGNRLAHAAALAVSASPGRAYNPYFVHGGVGLGKTHLLQAISLRLKQANPNIRIYYIACEAFVSQFIDAVKAGEMNGFRHRFREVDLLVIDDIHFLTKRDRTQEEFFHTFNSLYQAHKQIVLSSDAPPEEIPDLEDRLVSRFKWGLVTSIAPPCYETRVEILKNKARMRGLTLPDEVALHIAGRIDSNIRELEGAITKLHALSSFENRPIDLALAAQALGGGPGRETRQIHIQSIINAVTEYYSVKITDLQSKRRQRSIALPRQVCMFLARKHTRLSLEEIGGYFGGRDHTTVLHAVNAVKERCDVDPEFLRVIASLDAHVKAMAM